MQNSSDYVGSMTRLVQQLQSDDQRAREVAAAGLWARYATKLLDLAKQNLAVGVRRREDEMDIVQEAFASFCLRHEQGAFELHDRNDLWRLLVTITLCKARNAAERHQAAKRDVGREVAQRQESDDAPRADAWTLDRIRSASPTPVESAIFQEQLNRLLTALSQESQHIALWKLEGYSNSEIAGKLNRSERTVSRKLELIRIQLLEVASSKDP